MRVIPREGLWVEANFKEGELANLRVGQPASVSVDVYGGGVIFHGHVAGFSAGTGQAFALLPPQNAVGNWVKVVQRLPVRIALDPKELVDHPLRIGLSATVKIDTWIVPVRCWRRRPKPRPATNRPHRTQRW
jgi:membrane fusion protein (multidrug efflux system)